MDGIISISVHNTFLGENDTQPFIQKKNVDIFDNDEFKTNNNEFKMDTTKHSIEETVGVRSRA